MLWMSRSTRVPQMNGTKMYMQSELIEVKVNDCAGTIIINRPEHENRLTRLMIALLSDALDDLYREKKVRAIILTAAEDVFCAGMELSELQIEDASSQEPTDLEDETWGNDAAAFRDLLLRMLEITKPIIASVNGPALSAGAGLVAASDIVVASKEASFGVPDPKLGLVGGVVAPLVCHRLGVGQATRMMLTSEVLEAEEAHKFGIFHELLDSGQIWARANEIAKQCAEGAPEAIQLTKRLINETIGENLASQLTTGAIMQATACTTEAAQEGIAAFLEDRKPNWK